MSRRTYPIRNAKSGSSAAPSPDLRARLLRISIAAVLFVLGCAPVGKAQTLTTLYSFCSQTNCADGENPIAGLVQGTDGNFYGTASAGGFTSNTGTVFQITPTGVLTTLYSFCAAYGPNCADGFSFTDGFAPAAALVQASDGVFYGTTGGGGTNGNYGTVFSITSAGTYTSLYSFCSQPECADGQLPGEARLVQGSDGNFYGETASGGIGGTSALESGYGTIFTITPGGALTTLYSFCSQQSGSLCLDGSDPQGGLVLGSDGNFYGETQGGANDEGTVFRLTPSGTLTTLYSFCSQSNCTDGEDPIGGLVQGTDGNFYGETHGGGANYFGTIFKLTPSGTLTTLYSFCSQTDCTDGGDPSGGLMEATDGNFYGTTSSGGTGANNVHGTIFNITSAGTLTTLYSFCSQVSSGGVCEDGALPQSGVIQATDGNFYGTTTQGGGTDGVGTVFKLVLPASTTNVSPVSGGGQSAVVGQPFANALEVSVTNSNGSPVSGATVTFTAPSSGASAMLSSATATTNSNGIASVTAAANWIAGISPYQVSASVAGASAPATFSMTNLQETTSLSVAVNPSPGTTGASLTATATIVPEYAIPSMGGSATFTATPSGSSKATTLCAQVSVTNNAGSWQAACAFTENTAGMYTIAAAYSGDTSDEGSNGSVSLTVNQGTSPPEPGTVAGLTMPLAISANNSGTDLNAVLNSDSSVSLVQNGTLVSGVSCPAFAGLSGSTVSAGAVFLDGANARIYVSMIATANGTSSLYAAWETFNVQEGSCTPGPLLQIATQALSNLEMNVDVSQGDIYILNSFGALPDSLYVLPAATWSASSLPTPVQLTLDYSVQYGPIVVDPQYHRIYIDDLGAGSIPQGINTTAGFFVYDPNQSGTPANNLLWVAGYSVAGVTTPFNEVALFMEGTTGKLILVNQNPSSAPALTDPVTILDTTQFNFFTSSQPATGSAVNISPPAAAVSNIQSQNAYNAIGGADIDPANPLVYGTAYNANLPIDQSQTGWLLEWNLNSLTETALSTSMPLAQIPGPAQPWSQLNYDSESTQIVLSVSRNEASALALTSPLCAGSPSLTQILGSSQSSETIGYPAVNTASGYTYAIQPGSSYPPPAEPGALFFVGAPPSTCGTSAPVQISPSTLAPGIAGTPYSQPLVATGGSGTGYSWSVTSGASALNQEGITLSSATGLLSGTPAAAGAFTFTVQVTDSQNNTATQNYVFTVYPLLTISPATLPSGTNNIPYSQTLTAMGGSGSGYTWQLLSGSAALQALGLTLSAGTAPGTETIGGTPSAAGTTGLTVEVKDSAGDTATQTYVLTIANPTTTTVSINDPETVIVNDSETEVQLVDVSDSETITVTDIPVVTVEGASSLALSGQVQIAYGQTETLTATVTGSGSATPTGAVTFSMAGGATLATVNLNSSGIATYTTTTLPVGVDIIEAVYNGSTQFVASAPTAYPVQVTKAGTTTLLTETADPTAGYSTTFAATVTPTTSGTPTGTVTFYDGTTVMGTGALSGGVATYPTDTLPGGSDTIMATYGGDADYIGSTSNALSLLVADFSMTFSSSAGSLLPGQSATFTMTVTPTNGSYNEPVTFSVSGLPSGATAAFEPASLTPGSRSATAKLTITAPPLSAKSGPGPLFRNAASGLLALLLPIAAFYRKRRQLRSMLLLAIATLTLASLTGLMGCGASGFFNQVPKTYTVTVTGSSGAVQHSTTLTLTVE
jgi:uncharacterized repeat protein (TIGR03803 family)